MADAVRGVCCAIGAFSLYVGKGCVCFGCSGRLNGLVSSGVAARNDGTGARRDARPIR